MARPTLRHLAEELDLSITTVSRGLAGYQDVAQATQIRVREAASRAGYVPNSAGKSLVTGRSGFVGLVLPLGDPPVIDPFLGEFLTGLGEGLVSRGNDLFLATTQANQSEMDVLQHVVESGRADGLVLTRVSEQDERVDYLIERGFPFITHGRTLNHSLAHGWVDTDGAAAFAESFRLLYAAGHRQFALLSINEPQSFRRFREDGLQAAIADARDDTVSLTLCRTPRFDATARSSAIGELLSSASRPTAILALTDELALSVLEKAAEIGIDVPGQLSVVGFDNLPASGWVSPTLTTFDQHTRETAVQLAHRLVDLIEGSLADRHKNPSQHLISPTLVHRASHGPAPSRATDTSNRRGDANVANPPHNPEPQHH